jgi:glycosyltransferase involved in cell wall biosynthesis
MGNYFTDIILSQSQEDVKTIINKKIIKKNKIFWISNGVNLKKFNTSFNENLKKSLGFQPKDKIIIFVGRLTKEKGAEDLLNSMKKISREIPTAKLLIVGEKFKDERKKIDETKFFKKNIISVGYREDIPQILSISDVFVLPSHREGMPRSIIEAMASGKPVVATNIRGCREEVVHNETGFIVSLKDSDALAKAVITILSDEELAKKMGIAGKKRAWELFDEEKVLEREMIVYKEIKDKIYKNEI